MSQVQILEVASLLVVEKLITFILSQTEPRPPFFIYITQFFCDRFLDPSLELLLDLWWAKRDLWYTQVHALLPC